MLRGFAPSHLLTGSAREQPLGASFYFVEPEGHFVFFVVCPSSLGSHHLGIHPETVCLLFPKPAHHA